MGSPYLSSDESIILSTNNVVVNSVPSEAMLTSRRLILADSSHTQFRPKDIPFAAIATVLPGEAATGFPAITLSIATRGGATKPVQITFPQQPRSKRDGERDEWIAKLREQIARVPPGTVLTGADLPEDESPEPVSGALADAAGGAAPAEPGRHAPLSARFHPPAQAKTRPYLLIAAVAGILIILAGAGAAFIYPGFMLEKNPVPPLPAVTPLPGPEMTAVPVITSALPTAVPTTATVLTVVPEAPPGVIIPQAGVWVRIGYTGNYTGTIGTSGRMREISGAGERWIQVPARSTDIVDIFIQKKDTTGILLTLEVYNQGEIVKSASTYAPRGSLELHVNLRTAPTPSVAP